jgi:hypothetical protein
MAGHYFAYIHDAERQQWLRFDDLNVTAVADQDLLSAIGGGDEQPGKPSAATPYMCMYRRGAAMAGETSAQGGPFAPVPESLRQFLASLPSSAAAAVSRAPAAAASGERGIRIHHAPATGAPASQNGVR